MARTPQGRALRAFPVLTEGYSDNVWAASGEASRVDGVMFLVTGEVRKSLGVRELIKWDSLEFPFYLQRVDAIASVKITNGPHELVVAHGGGLSRISGRKAVSIASGRSVPRDPASGEMFGAHAGWLFWANGTDGNQKWNGDYTTSVGVSEVPSAPRVDQLEEAIFPAKYSIASGATAHTHQVRCSFVNSSGQEGSIGPVSNAETIPSGAASPVVAKYSGMSIPVAHDIMWRNVYKRAQDGVYYLWRRLAAGESVCYDFDAPLATGASGGVVVDEERTPPPTSKLIAFFRGRGYYVPVTSPSFIVYSYPSKVEEVKGLNFLEVNSSDGQEITALVHFIDMLVVFKETSVWTISARPDGSPVLSPIDTGVGCIAPRSIIRLYNQLLFIGRDGVYSFDGGNVKPASNRLNRWWSLLPQDYLVNACAVHDEEKRQVIFAISTSTGNANDTLLTYHYDVGGAAWSMTEGHSIHALYLYEHMVLAGVEDENRSGNIVVLDGSYSGTVIGYDSEGNPDGTTSVYTPRGNIRFGPYGQKGSFSSEETMELFGLDVFFRYTGSHNLTANIFADRNPLAEQTRAFGLNASGALANKTGNQDLALKTGWGEKNWGAGTWSGDQVLFQRIQFPSPVICREFEVEFVNDDADAPWEIVAFIPWFSRKGSERQR